MKKKILLTTFLSAILQYTSLAQNIGIGTTTPVSKLHVRGTGGGNQIILEETSGSVLRVSNEANAAGPYIGTSSAHSFSLVSGNAVRMTVTSSGNIGIGTNTPSQRLDINGAIKLGNTTTDIPGSIRFNNNRFEGHNGTNWKSFEQLSSGSVITSYNAPDTALQNRGYQFIGGIPGVVTQSTTTTTVPANSWLPISSTLYHQPGIKGSHSAVWTGDHFMVWGGVDIDNDNGSIPYPVSNNDGYYLSFDTNIWDTIPKLNSPSARFDHSTVWTGTDMIVYGGRQSNNNGTYTTLNNGGRFSNTVFKWNTIANAASRYKHTAVWTGTEMIVWGGLSNATTPLNTGGRFTINTDSWSPITVTNAPTARFGHTAIWTGTEMIIWGGISSSNVPTNTGALYNPGTNTWTTITTTNAPTARSGHSAVWNGTEMIIWGGLGGGSETNSGARYNPATNVWTTMSIVNAPSPRTNHAAIWANSSMYVYGGESSSLGELQGYRYSTASGWTALSTISTPAGNDNSIYNSSALWTGNFFIFWGGFNDYLSGSKYSTTVGYRYFPTAETITNITERTRVVYLYEKQ